MGKKPKILVVGSFVMDQIVTTRVFPRQGQTILAERFNKAPGGKGANQAVQMARLGAQVTMCGKLGHDANGDEMRRTCEEAGIDTSCILYDCLLYTSGIVSGGAHIFGHEIRAIFEAFEKGENEKAKELFVPMYRFCKTTGQNGRILPNSLLRPAIEAVTGIKLGPARLPLDVYKRQCLYPAHEREGKGGQAQRDV